MIKNPTTNHKSNSNFFFGLGINITNKLVLIRKMNKVEIINFFLLVLFFLCRFDPVVRGPYRPKLSQIQVILAVRQVMAGCFRFILGAK